MDFSSFKAKKSNTDGIKKAVTKTPFLSLEGQQNIKVIQGYSHYSKVYQGCDTCKTEVLHAIIGMKVLCLGCENSYLLMDRKEYDKQNAPIDLSKFKIVSSKMEMSWCSSILFI